MTKTCTTISDDARLCEITQLPSDGGIYQTLYIMRDLARQDAGNPEILAVVEGVRQKRPLDTAYALWDWMTDRFPYVKDPAEYEAVKAPRHTLSRKYDKTYPWRDCDDLSTLMACLLKAAGLTSYLKALAWRKRAFTHVYNWVQVPQGFFPIDCVMKKDGFGREQTPERRSVYLKI
ncbi:MAG: hypothetical protein HYX66_08980 [Ignavibacteria bacterium]|nr:hypothetical protein [Ignavibacteria bacterium]